MKFQIHCSDVDDGDDEDEADDALLMPTGSK